MIIYIDCHIQILCERTYIFIVIDTCGKNTLHDSRKQPVRTTISPSLFQCWLLSVFSLIADLFTQSNLSHELFLKSHLCWDKVHIQNKYRAWDLSPLSNFRTFSSPTRSKPCPHWVTPIPYSLFLWQPLNYFLFLWFTLLGISYKWNRIIFMLLPGFSFT